MTVPFFDARHEDVSPVIERIRRLLGPQGNCVSVAGRAKTREVFGADLSPAESVRRICDAVRTKGLAAVLDFTRRFDEVDLARESLRVSDAELQQAHHTVDPAFLSAVRRVRANIQKFQTAILHRDVSLESQPGLALRHCYRPLRRVGLCIPGGAAAYPSSLLMTAVPAQVAGVDEIVMVAPPTQNGAYNPKLLATCHELGIHEVYRIGGAQAVAALAYGIEGLPAVDKIVGPGNLYVALAKKYVFGQVDIDAIAGPSEVVIIADESAATAIVAAELLAQAEHAPGASFLITWHPPLARAVIHQLDQQLQTLPRADQIRACLDEFSAIFLVADEFQACHLADLLAPEHLQISVAQPSKLTARIRNAGAIFEGYSSPVAAGDYVAGPSHVLPTGGTARWSSGLTANTFLRSFSIIHLTQSGLAGTADVICTMAQTEGLQAHWESVAVRLGPETSPGDTP